MSELSDRDLDLMARVGATFAEIDPVPEDVLAAARATLGWGMSAATLDAELAELVEDTSVSGMVGIRGTEAPRLVTFESESLTVEVEVSPQGGRRRRSDVPAELAGLRCTPGKRRDVDVTSWALRVSDVPRDRSDCCSAAGTQTRARRPGP